MNRYEAELLKTVISSGKTERPMGDAPFAIGLQAGGMAVVTYLRDGKHIDVRPTETGKRWYALVTNHTAAEDRFSDHYARRLMGDI